MSNKQDNIERLALLEDGRIVEYDVMSCDKFAVNDRFYLFLGAGTIYSINGLAANDRGRKFFWRKKEEKNGK